MFKKIYDFKDKFEFMFRERLHPINNSRPMIKFIKTLNGKNLVGIEIGVASGDNAYNILLVNDIKTLYLVDPYCKYFVGSILEDYSVYEKIAHKRLRRFNDKIIWVKDFSDKCVDFIPDGLDFVYIDGNHSYDFVKKDIQLYYPKVKTGGVFGGHDYDASNLGVVKAVNEFVENNKLVLDGYRNDWWVIK